MEYMCNIVQKQDVERARSMKTLIPSLGNPLLEDGLDVDERFDEHRNAPLHGIIEDWDGCIPLHSAVKKGYEWGVNLLTRDGRSLLSIAVELQKQDVVKDLLDHEANSNLMMSPKLFSPLHGTTSQSWKRCHSLFNHGAETKARSYEGHTGLLYEAERDHSAVVQSLADMEANFPYARSPLFVACGFEHLQSLQVQLDCGVDVNRRTKKLAPSCSGCA
eukprot:scaffold574_cov190-Amphora_coffeaeformis.AAC.22